jgi:uncharacterized repeat protein (TIGR03803 family)
MVPKTGWNILKIIALALAASLLVPVAARAQTETALHAFTGGEDGAVSFANLVFDNAGNSYGTTEQGGYGPCPSGFFRECGTVFELLRSMDGRWEKRVIYAFQGGRDGANPHAGLVFDKSGNLYGSTAWGGRGNNGIGFGTVFELQRSSTGWRERVLYRFSGGKDGAYPDASLVFDGEGNLYGTTPYGGDNNCYYYGSGCGVVFELKHSKAGWREQVLHTFTGSDGADPFAEVTFDKTGNLYGTTWAGGSGGGVVFQLKHSGGVWTESTVYAFPVYNGSPEGGLVVDGNGNLYGATEFGGNNGSGSVFEMTPSGSGWVQIALHSFNGYDGWFPTAGVTFDKAGNLYGTTGGSNTGTCQDGCGLVFVLKKADNWAETILHKFTGGVDGAYPWASLALDARGSVYGTTIAGGDANCKGDYKGCGVVFKIRP